MDSGSLVHPGRHFTLLETSEELVGFLEVGGRPMMSGGYANIYHGLWTNPHGERVEVAVKELKAIIPKNQQTKPEELIRKAEMRIAREAFVWSRIQHRNLQPLLGYRSQPEPRLISPWCRHGNLLDYIRANAGLSRLDKLTLIYQAAYGLEHLHSRTPPISHADVKPENVLVNDWCEAVLSDFGLSRVLHGLDIPSGFTTSETVKGTFRYKARELFDGEQPTCESDVYAFGGLVLTVMSGKPPFWDLREPNTLHRIISNQPPRPEDHPDLPDSDPLWGLMRHCWNQNPKARPTMRRALWELWELISLETSELRSKTGTLSVPDGGSNEAMDLDNLDEARQSGVPVQSKANLYPVHRLLSSIAGVKESLGSVARGVFPPARETFKELQVSSKALPVLGKYIRAAVEVGLMLIEIVKTIDRNRDTANTLESSTWKLAVFVDRLRDNLSGQRRDEIASCIADIRQELQSVQRHFKELYSLGLFPKAMSCCDHTKGRKQWEAAVLKAWETMELFVNLEATTLMAELKDSRLQEDQCRLLNRLGDGKYGARGNAIEDVVCLPGTRVEILERIDDWIRDTSTANRVLWIRAMAGRGKSTIASTVTHNWQYRTSCALFHFRRGQNTLDGWVVCALARQLASSLVPEVREAVLESVRENQDIADQRLSIQFETLLVAPLSRLKNQRHTILVVVDALDECENPQYAEDFVKLLDRHSSSLPINVKFLLTCRPEAALLRTLVPRRWYVENLDCSSDVLNDLARFFDQAFGQIREDHSLPGDWPSRSDVNRLVEMSQGLFQWARTAITYIAHRSPANRLQDLLKRPSTWSGLDDLYHQVLSKAFENTRLDPSRRELLSRILGTLVVAPHPTSLEVITALCWNENTTIFEGASQDATTQFLCQDILADLHSLLLIPSSPTEPLCLMHSSIRDLLISEPRCQHQAYYINIVEHHERLAGVCLRLMVQCLKENICNLSDLSKPNSEIQDIVDREVTTTIRYCCRVWSIHLSEGTHWSRLRMPSLSYLRLDFEMFSKKLVLCWLEVMSLTGVTTEAMVAARRVHEWLLQCPADVSESDSFKTLWSDTQRFIAAFSEPISFGSLHIYFSALTHCPQKTRLWEWYGKCARIRTVRGVQPLTWPCNLWTRSAGHAVHAVAVSPDNATLASGSSDGLVRLWEAQTGAPLGEPLIGHDGPVSCVAFSPDGKVLASGSKDRTIRLWDTHLGTTLCEPLTGHDRLICSVVFSPNGKLLASGSDDRAIRLWDTKTRRPLGEPLKGHNGMVASIVFSPNGVVLASGSADGQIRLWDTQTRMPLGEPLTDNDGWVSSVAFSPDGKILAFGSGSHHGAIRLLDTQTGTPLGAPCTGHDGPVSSVTFSPDGKVLASASKDRTIRFWDTQTGTTLNEPLTGHDDWVRSVAFSPDGKVLASGSDDGTIRLWDTQTGTPLGKPSTGSEDGVSSVAFSPDGKVLTSGSKDSLIRLWDTQTGMPFGEPLRGHHGSVYSVAVSPDGNVLASGSKDSTIRLWDTRTGMPQGEPLRGHHGSVYSIAFSPDSNVLASGSKDRTVRLWDVRTGSPLGEPLTAHRASVYSVAFSPISNVLASGSKDRTIRLWDAQARISLGEPLIGQHGSVYFVAFSPDGKDLAFASGLHHSTIRLWDTQTRIPLRKPLTGYQDWASSVACPPQGKAPESKSEGGGIRVWNANTRVPLPTNCKTEQADTTFDPFSQVVLQGPRTLPCSFLQFHDHWVVSSSSRWLWLPSQYWADESPVILFSHGSLAIVSNGSLSIFNIPGVSCEPHFVI